MRQGLFRDLLAAAVLLTVALPNVVLGHSALESSTVSDGDVLEPPFRQRIVLTFSEELAEGSGAKLIRADEFRDSEGVLQPPGGVVASAEVDGPAATMTFPLITFGQQAEWRIEWTSIATDGDLLRGTINFSVKATLPSSSPTAIPTVEPLETPSSPEATIMVSPSEMPSTSPTPGLTGTAGTADVLIPIIVGLLVVLGGGAYLFNRRRQGGSR